MLGQHPTGLSLVASWQARLASPLGQLPQCSADPPTPTPTRRVASTPTTPTLGPATPACCWG